MDGLERKSQGALHVIRLDFLSAVGQAAARKYGVWMIPTIILFDEDGQEVGRQLNLINKL